MIVSYSECRSRIRDDSFALGVEGRTAHCDKLAYTWLHVSCGREAEIVREEGINPALATGVLRSDNVESARDVLKTLRLKLQDKDKQDLQAQMASSIGRCLLPEQPVRCKIEITNPAEMKDILHCSFAKDIK